MCLFFVAVVIFWNRKFFLKTGSIWCFTELKFKKLQVIEKIFGENKKKVYQVGITRSAVLYICRVGHCYGCVEFELNDLLLYTKNNIEWEDVLA